MQNEKESMLNLIPKICTIFIMETKLLSICQNIKLRDIKIN